MAADGMNDTMCLDRGMFHAMMQTLPPPSVNKLFAVCFQQKVLISCFSTTNHRYLRSEVMFLIEEL